jgi:hypothetical protein
MRLTEEMSRTKAAQMSGKDAVLSELSKCFTKTVMHSQIDKMMRNVDNICLILL